MTDRYVDYVRLDQVQLAPRNPKGHHGEGIARSINHHGFAELPLLDERTGRLVAGHGRHEQLAAMQTAGHKPPDGVRVDDDGTWHMPVIRGWASRSDADAEAYLIGSNQWTIAGGWNDTDLAAVLGELAEQDMLELTGFTNDDLDALLAEPGGVEELPPAARTDPDAVPEPPADPVTKPGDVWLLGPHRVLCGDATNPDHLQLVTDGAEVGIVYTDPPYGIDIVSESGKVGARVGYPFGGRKNGTEGSSKSIHTTLYRPVAGDANPDIASDAFRLLCTTYLTASHIWWGGNHYAASSGLPNSSCWLVWDKETNGNFADAELAWTNHPGAVRLLRHMWNGMLRASERGGGQRVHPTQKPVALAVWAFSVVDRDAERRTVLDVFAGSGSTLIAAHQTGRTAFLVELEPHYVDVISRRFQEHTGIMPVLASTGGEHDFTVSAEG